MGDKAEKKEKKPQKKKQDANKGETTLLKADQIIAGDKGNQYLVESMLGKGGFGEVYKVSSLKDPEKKFAMKVETNFIDKQRQNMLRLKVEIHVFDAIMRASDVDKTHFVKMHDKGKTQTFKYYVMDIIWLSLKDVIDKVCKGVLSPHAKINVARQTLKSLETFHEIGFLHRDVKWHNFAVGLPPNDHIIYCLDFGIARPYREADGSVKVGRAKVQFMGTIKYASIRGLSGLEQCRKDDLESWLYMMLEIYDRGNLGWMCFDFRKQVDMVIRTKQEVMVNSRVFVKNGSLKIPIQYCAIIDKINRMSYKCEGNFHFFNLTLDTLVKEEKIDMNLPLDWVGKKLPDEPKKDLTSKTKKVKKAKKISQQTEDENKEMMDENREIERELMKMREKERKRGKKGRTEDDNGRSDEDDSEDDYSDEDEEEEERRRKRRKARKKRTRERTSDFSEGDDRRRRRRGTSGGRRRRDSDRETQEDGPRRRRRQRDKTRATCEDQSKFAPFPVDDDIEKEQKKAKEDKPAEKPKGKVAEMLDDGAYMDLGAANDMEKIQDAKDGKGSEEKKKEGEGGTPKLTLLSVGPPPAKPPSPEAVSVTANKEPAERKKK